MNWIAFNLKKKKSILVEMKLYDSGIKVNVLQKLPKSLICPLTCFAATGERVEVVVWEGG